MKKTLANILEEARQSHSYKREEVVLSLTEEILALMRDQGINKTELAKRLGKSPPYITKILSGSANFTLTSLVSLAEALNAKVNVHLSEKHCHTHWLDEHSYQVTTYQQQTCVDWNSWKPDEFIEQPEEKVA